MSLFKRLRFETENIRGPLRTTGALLIGNGPIGFFVLGNRSMDQLITVSVIGVVIVLLLSITFKPKS
jgi:hypothetical protein